MTPSFSTMIINLNIPLAIAFRVSRFPSNSLIFFYQNFFPHETVFTFSSSFKVQNILLTLAKKANTYVTYLVLTQIISQEVNNVQTSWIMDM